MTDARLRAEKQHLANLLEAIQRCTYFLDASARKLPWPLQKDYLDKNQKNIEVFESLAAVNERFAKLQDVLGSAMRHAALLAGEPADSFMKVLAFYEKAGVIESVSDWQLFRTVRNLAAHDYETDYGQIAEHFNALKELLEPLEQSAQKFVVLRRLLWNTRQHIQATAIKQDAISKTCKRPIASRIGFNCLDL